MRHELVTPIRFTAVGEGRKVAPPGATQKVMKVWYVWICDGCGVWGGHGDVTDDELPVFLVELPSRRGEHYCVACAATIEEKAAP